MIFSAAYNHNAFAGDAVLTWDPNIEPDLAGYKIYYGTTSGGPYNGTSSVAGMNSPVDVGNQISSTVTGLGTGTYYFAGAAYDSSNNESGFSIEVSKTFSGPDTTPPVISGITASNITSTGAVITWSTNEQADSQVQYGTTTAYGSSTTLDSTQVNNHSVILSGLSVPITYHFRVLSRDAAGNLATSGDNTFTTTAAPDTTAPTITGITAGNIASTSAVITWATDEAATSQIQYGATTAYGSSTTLDSTLFTSHSVTLSGLSASTTYHFQILSQDASGNLATSGDNTLTSSALSDIAPNQIAGSNPNPTISGGCGMIRPSDGKPSGPGQAADMLMVLALPLIALLRRKIKELLDHSPSFRRIEGMPNRITMGAWLAAGMVLAATGCGGQSNSTSSANPPAGGSGTAELSWDANSESDLSGYKVCFGTAPATYGAPIDVGNTTAYKVSGLQDGVRYYFAVTAHDTSNSESVLSEETYKDIL